MGLTGWGKNRDPSHAPVTGSRSAAAPGDIRLKTQISPPQHGSHTPPGGKSNARARQIYQPVTGVSFTVPAHNEEFLLAGTLEAIQCRCRSNRAAPCSVCSLD
jgi:hypothetical protein